MTTVAAIALVTFLHAVSAPLPQASGLAEDVGRLSAATTNEARFDALTAMLETVA